jgi:hypothetical protein
MKGIEGKTSRFEGKSIPEVTLRSILEGTH